jgi:hypothetical protein
VQIVCTTPHAAAQVLTILYAAHLHAVRDFTIQPILSTKPPFIFTLLVILTAAQVRKLSAVSDATVSE